MTLHEVVLGLPPVAVTLQVAVLALLALAVTLVVSFLYRIHNKTIFPGSVAALLGLGVVGLVLNTRHAFVQFIGGSPDALTLSTALVNVTALAVAGVASAVGNRIGVRLAESERVRDGDLRLDVSPLVRATGRFTTVTLPEEVADVDGYDPVPDETREELQGKTLTFPRGLTVRRLEEQIALRLRENHNVGYVDAQIEPDGTVTHLGLGYRPAGLGPTLPPDGVAVALRADPPFSATPGDAVQIWEPGPEPERLGVGELRAAVGPVATVATDPAVADALDRETRYRLVTLPGTSQPERDFAATLRRADETLGVAVVAEDSPLVGTPLGSLDVNVIAVRAADGDVEAIPPRDRPIGPGDQLFALGRPEALRTLEEGAGGGTPDVEALLEEARAAVDPAPPPPDAGSGSGG